MKINLRLMAHQSWGDAVSVGDEPVVQSRPRDDCLMQFLVFSVRGKEKQTCCLTEAYLDALVVRYLC